MSTEVSKKAQTAERALREHMQAARNDPRIKGVPMVEMWITQLLDAVHALHHPEQTDEREAP
jgi:hypothetical protein